MDALGLRAPLLCYRQFRWLFFVFFSCPLLSAVAQVPVTSIPQVERSAVDGYVDGPAPAARFMGNLSVYADVDGSVLIADGSASALRRLDRQGRVSTVAGTPGERGFIDGDRRKARLSYPAELARLPDGRWVMIEARGKGRSENAPGLRTIDRQGNVRRLVLQAGTTIGPAPVGHEARIAAEALEAKLRGEVRREPKREVRELAPERLLPSPSGVAVDAKGRIWIADSGYSMMRTMVIDTQGRVHHWLPGADLRLREIARAPDGVLWGASQNALFRLHDDWAEPVVSVETVEWMYPVDLAYPVEEGPTWALIGKVRFIGRNPQPPRVPVPPSRLPAWFTGLAFDQQGRVLVADRKQLLRLEAESNQLTTLFEAAESEYEGRRYAGRDVESLAVDSSGRILMVGEQPRAIHALRADGSVEIVAGGE